MLDSESFESSEASKPSARAKDDSKIAGFVGCLSIVEQFTEEGCHCCGFKSRGYSRLLKPGGEKSGLRDKISAFRLKYCSVNYNKVKKAKQFKPSSLSPVELFSSCKVDQVLVVSVDD